MNKILILFPGQIASMDFFFKELQQITFIFIFVFTICGEYNMLTYWIYNIDELYEN